MKEFHAPSLLKGEQQTLSSFMDSITIHIPTTRFTAYSLLNKWHYHIGHDKELLIFCRKKQAKDRNKNMKL